jgi:hypothetical protein
MGTDNKYAPIEETTKTNPNPAQYRYICFFLVPNFMERAGIARSRQMLPTA